MAETEKMKQIFIWSLFVRLHISPFPGVFLDGVLDGLRIAPIPFFG